MNNNALVREEFFIPFSTCLKISESTEKLHRGEGRRVVPECHTEGDGISVTH